MSISRDGGPLMLGTVTLSVLLFALALRLRSWPLWLLGFASLLAALSLAWVSRGTMLPEMARS